MTDDRSLERAARSWLEEGPTRAPERPVDAALARIQKTSQERGLLVPWRFPTVNPVIKVATAALAAVLAIGGFLYAFGGTNGVGGPPTPSPAPTITDAPTSPPAGATAAPFVGACRLLSEAEVIASAGIPGLGARPSELNSGNESTCLYSSGGGDVILLLTLTSPGGNAAFDVATNLPGVESVADLGDDARFDPATANLYTLQGDSMLLLRAKAFDMSQAASLAAERTLARLALERL